MKLTVLSNINIDPIKSQLNKVGFDEVRMAGYNQFMFELLNPQSALHTQAPQAAFFHLDGDELLNVSLDDGTIKWEKGMVNDFLTQVALYARSTPATTIILSGIVLSPFTILTHLNHNSGISVPRIQETVNRKIEKTAREHANIHYFDFPAIVTHYGLESLVDDKFWYLGRIKYTNTAYVQLARHLKSLVDAIHGKTRKVLVLDLDNTLWGGVIGEDDLQGIQLSEEGIGKVYRDFQQHIKDLKSIGVLLAICSKNNEADAMEVIEKHPMMVLHDSDFVAKTINWNNKADNIRRISKELELGLDSFVFIDDNPVERELVRQNLPDVMVPEFPKEIEKLNKWFISDVVYPFFPKVILTNEDNVKTDQYKRNIQRKAFEITLDLNEYIRSLNIKLNISLNDKSQIARISQLTQKTNQFNLTTRRYTEGEIGQFMDDSSKRVYAVDYSDKFGKEGIIAVVIIDILSKDAIHIDTFLMSCRVIGRNVELSILESIIGSLSKETPLKTIQADYIITAKNSLAKDFYTKCGFEASGSRVLAKETLLSNLSTLQHG